MTDVERLCKLLTAGHACIRIVTLEEDEAVQLVRDAAMQLNLPMLLWTTDGGVHDGLIAGTPLMPGTTEAAAALCHFADVEASVCTALDLGPHLKNDRVLRVFRNALRRLKAHRSCLVMIDHDDNIPPVAAAYATRFDLPLPDDRALEQLVRDTLRRLNREKPLEVEITRRGLSAVIRNLRGLSRRLAEQIIVETVADDRRFDESDFHTILSGKRRALHGGGLLEFIECPVDLGEIGGLRRLKRWLELRQNALTDEAADFGLDAPRGVLMLGVQGAGKSLCAKAISTAWQRPLLRMDVGALYDRYVGESERRLADALRQAEAMAPIILWTDEIEKACASSASRSTDGGLSQRMFGSLLTWMQEHRAPVFLVATANDIEALPPELLRKGRFDEIFFVDLPVALVRRDIFEIHLRKRRRDPSAFDLDRLAAASDGYSGAEIEQTIIAALHEAFAESADVTTDRIVAALRASPPLSVMMAERVEALRGWAVGRCVPAD